MELNNQVAIGEYKFRPYLDAEEIYLQVKEIAYGINQKFQHDIPIVIVLMNGACFFAIDLLRMLNFLPQILFIKASSYHEMEATGQVEIQSLDNIDLLHQDVLIIEDIIDTGATMHQFEQILQSKGVKSISIASLLVKPNKLKYPMNIDFTGFTISDDFVVGYGLDYNNIGRNLPSIYQLIE